MAAPESSAFGTNPRAPLFSISEPKSVASRLETSTTDVVSRSPHSMTDVEAAHVGQLYVEQHDVRAERAEHARAPSNRPPPRR